MTTTPVVALLPGLLCDAAVWMPQRAALAAGGVTGFVPDWGELSSLTEMARRVLDQAPAAQFALAGHSMGGRVALEVMRLAPGRVTRLALMDTGVEPLDAGAAGQQERAQRLELLALARSQGMRAMARQWARGMVHPAHLATPVFNAILDMFERKTPAIFAAQIEALLARPDARGALAAVTCPTLLLCGRQDAWSTFARHQQMQALLPAARLMAVEDAGHMVTLEQPEAVSAALVRWLT
jgi:pimeloyl-ACP methyl ester carboxylesterase